MPTPVSAARQCLTEEAARALDDAVAVARRRGHAQTTSLHAVSALLALPSSALREACARARSTAYSPRLQFRALELSVGVSLDRLPSAKAVDEPPVSNSLMAAIKRSQANQRRHPDSFHFHSQMLAGAASSAAAAAGPQAAPVLRVEMKHFVLSILDDPIVSRVLGEAGFRSCDIKLAILHPPLRQLSPYGRVSRCPPLFLCNLADSDLSPARRAAGLGQLGFGFPFSRAGDGQDENSRRIGEVLARKSERNPLLLGACAGEALRCFADGLRGEGAGLLPPEIGRLAAVAIEGEMAEFVAGDGGGEAKLNSRLEEAVGQCSDGAGVVVSFGDLKGFVGDGAGGCVDRAGTVVSLLKSLLEAHAGKVWLIGAAVSYDVYSKFTGLFPSAEKDLDLHILPITSSSKASSDGPHAKSSLMGSFVPFGGFFAAPSELKSPCSSTNQFTRCLACTERYEQEVASVLKAGSTLSVANPYSENLPCLQMAEIDAGKAVDVMKAKDGRTTLSAKISELQTKWNDICQRLHQAQPGYKTDVFQAGSVVPSIEGFQGSVRPKQSGGEDSGINEMRSTLPSSCSVTNLQKNFSSKPSSLTTTASDSEKSAKGSESSPIEIGSPDFRPRPLQDMNLPPDSTLAPASFVTSVTTDLGLGTIYAAPSTNKEQQPPGLQDLRVRPQPSPGTYSIAYDAASACASRRVFQSSPCPISSFKGQFDPCDLKSFKRVLIEKVGRQDEAISAVSQAVCCVRSGGGRDRGSNLRGDIWVAFLGPDKVGKKRIALALAEMLYGSRESLISVDLGCQNRGFRTNSIFQDDDDYDLKFRGKTVVDYLAEELSRKHHSVVFLENIDKADMLAQNSLSQAIRTGKFRDSRGREISIKNTVFVTTTTTVKGKMSHHPDKDPVQFPEDIIVAAKKFQMNIVIDSFPCKTTPNHGMNVRVTPKEATSNLSSSINKRKLIDTRGSTEQALESQKRAQKASRSFLDLNVPVEEIEESADTGEYDSDSISESSEAWLEDFLEQVDEKVALKPFDFDALFRKILEDINSNFKRILGPEVSLEIDYNAMVQILGAAWLLEEKRAVEDWISRVLCRAFAEAEQKYKCALRCAMRLIASEPLIAEEQTSCVCLPARISLN